MKVGIDVSHWNGDIDWAVVGKFVDFAIIKCGGWETNPYEDPKFLDNYAGAADVCSVGSYYYAGEALLKEGGKSLAEHCLQIMEDRLFKYPIFVDIEDISFTYKRDEVTREVNNFIDVISSCYIPGVYGSEISTYCSMINKNDLRAAVKWVANYSRRPETMEWDFWQYTGSGQILGVNTPVDINIEIQGDSDYWKVVNQVISGLWGNGEGRKRLLKTFGYDVNKVQRLVNESLKMRYEKR